MKPGVALDTTDPDDGFTAFHFACFHNQAECAEELAQAGCDIHLKTKSGLAGPILLGEIGHNVWIDT
jgi:ankyrin repeat protein